VASAGLGSAVRDSAVGTYLAGAWAEPPGPVAFVHHLQFDLRAFDDDRTAVAVWAR
jgi:hypothetical protein